MNKISNNHILERKSGILLHPTSFPGKHGIGELGREAFQFIDFLEESGQTLWQVLPLGPTGYGDSPYASFSTHAGNPMLISLQILIGEGLLSEDELKDEPEFDAGSIDFGTIIPWKKSILDKAAKKFSKSGKTGDFDRFCREEAHWLEDFALFMAVKEHFDSKAQAEGIHGAMWSNYWDRDIALREPRAVKKWSADLKAEVETHKVLQFFFFRQWLKVKKYANSRGIEIIGDIPIFVAADSADVWSNRELFLLNKDGSPSSVAGVPPDYFSETGQLWGNPLYDWKAMEKNKFRWWIERIKGTLKLVDTIRVDHFRGFEAFWQVPAGNETAVDGKWVKAPGQKLFREIRKVLGTLPILAEDLGVITEEVNALRDEFGFPGMRILQFAFDYAEGEAGLDPENIFLPHNYIANAVVYTGTHDNSTMQGWLDNSKDEERAFIREYTGYEGDNLVQEFIRMAMASVAAYCIIPMQDFLGLDDGARMNIPSTLGGNWQWRYKKEDLSEELKEKNLRLSRIYGRFPMK
ncbi:4-alpha-glucanotransferase [Spirochaeta isovalerica]|uniref:4-alpha-glucanotransferase n=1 Tax=Spirochaeta isovalerica TaxID=150 RepID=A0A841RIA7_9SPIO|nr:4-alpha-glucanotransferase [Spirochaeta isovalerica]MBB6482042.1 4-alpha-glucanotransferase [Spirochaeta isovalerica]